MGGIHRKPYEAGLQWAANLSAEIREGKFREESPSWLAGMNLDDPIQTSMKWANESNAYVCTTGKSNQARAVLP